MYTSIVLLLWAINLTNTQYTVYIANSGFAYDGCILMLHVHVVVLILHIRYLSKKGCELVAILRDYVYFVKTKLQTHHDCIIAQFVNSVNTYAYTYGHRSCAHFLNFTNVSMRIARTLREHTLLASLRKVFACVSLPFFDKYRTYNITVHVQYYMQSTLAYYILSNTCACMVATCTCTFMVFFSLHG